MGRFELPASPLPRECSTPELHGPNLFWSGWRESNPHRKLGRLLLYHWATPALLLQQLQDSCGGGRRIRTFEAFARDLQSPPFGRSGIPPQERLHINTPLPCSQHQFFWGMLKIIQQPVFYHYYFLSACSCLYLACNWSSVSGLTSSIKIQSTGHTCWHCGSS